MSPAAAARFVRAAEMANNFISQLNKETTMSFKHNTRVKATVKGNTYKGTVAGRKLTGKTGAWVIVKTSEHRKGQLAVRESQVRAY